VGPWKGPFVSSWVRLLDTGRSAHYSGYSWHDSAFFLAAEQRLLCGSSSVQARESSTMAGWRSSLATELFSSHERSCDC
jgi:hypothetical protein